MGERSLEATKKQMCGIAGVWKQRGGNGTSVFEIVSRMAATLSHRGPDDQGIWTSEDGRLSFGHRRLSILDRSSAGHQPMRSHCGRYVVAFNGEIYNFMEIRAELDEIGPPLDWRGHSDTEVMLAALSRWGIADSLTKFTGMFAIALWDRKTQLLHLARDRMGEKPLYYGWLGGSFVFGSELKSLRVHPEWSGEIDRNALALYVRYDYVPTPFSIYKGISKLPPGTVLSVRANGPSRGTDIPSPYWSIQRVAESGVRDRFVAGDGEAVDALEQLLKSVIRRQMVSDVPLGAFLSGGIDSSTVIALMQAESSRPVKTFTIGFDERGYDEALHAKAVARHLGTDHTELYVSPQDAMGVIPRLPTLYDEPFADSSQIPTFLVAQLARRQVTVSLSGDGGDELFGGYNRYFWATRFWNVMRWVPCSLRAAAAAWITRVRPERWDKVFADLAPVLPARLRQPMPGDKIHKLANVLGVRGPQQMYLGFVSRWERPAELVIGATEPETALTTPSTWAILSNFAERMMYLDSVTYLPDDILVKVDRAAMGVSLETRVPMLDHSIVEFAWRLPLHMKFRNGQGKWILREVLNRHVPKQLVERPKMGFSLPLDAWLRGGLRDWAEDLLGEKRLTEEGFLEPKPIREKWLQHLSGKRNWQYHLWNILVFQAWLTEERNALKAAEPERARSDFASHSFKDG
jgi:asparagine synthase (glutamine-hydrolysing)